MTSSKTCINTNVTKQQPELVNPNTIISFLSNFQFGWPVVTLKSMERMILALIKWSLFYGQLLIAGSFPGELLKHGINRSQQISIE